MSVDFNSTPQNSPTTNESETPMFAAVPAWERNRKRGMFGGKSRAGARAAEPVTEPVVERPAMILGDGPSVAAADTVDPTNSAFATAPAYASRPVKKGGGMAPMAIAAGIIAVGGLAAAGWYATQPRESGVAQLTPGTEATTTTTPVAPPAELAVNTAPAEAAPVTTTTTTAKAVTAAAKPATRVAATRSRPAPASRSAEEAGVNTAATLPAAPQPYSGTTTTTTAPTDVTTAPPAPAEAAPPVTAAPAPVTPPAAATPSVQTPPQ